MTDLTAEFHETMLRTYQEARQFDYHATRFRIMLEKHGGVETACRLLKAVNAQEGLTRLWEHGRLDLAVEYHILQPRFHDLFNESTRSEAAGRLEDLRYVVNDDGNLREFSSC